MAGAAVDVLHTLLQSTMVDIVMALIVAVMGLVSTSLSFALVFGITMPFLGVLVRYRANYTPKTGAVRLDEEDGAPRSVASIGYFGMMKRVHRLEGWAGLYKGIMPSIVTSLIALVAVVPISIFVLPHGWVYVPLHLRWTISLGMSLIPALLLVPMQIIINRAITTPHKLAAFDARTGLRVLLSPAERTQPLRLYLAPGVALAILLESLIVPSLALLRVSTKSLPGGFALGGALPVLLLTTALITPLEVMTARLTLQRRSGPGSAAVNSDEIPPPPVYSAEPVMEFRDTDVDGGEAPYTGLLDCTQKILAEEGWGVLTRAWWLTIVAMLLSAATPELLPPSRLLG
ncbi:hypothetical protein MVEN_02227500 [Mycena venus]|uniref:Mitochondrial carrier n=1 Tax=Mycena venus TaxID=2733690 RepID=A0A8H6X7Z6_9AGAR|nr:hypothetical protein MVEN_02227500 [Mycena venus]